MAIGFGVNYGGSKTKVSEDGEGRDDDASDSYEAKIFGGQEVSQGEGRKDRDDLGPDGDDSDPKYTLTGALFEGKFWLSLGWGVHGGYYTILAGKGIYGEDLSF